MRELLSGQDKCRGTPGKTRSVCKYYSQNNVVGGVENYGEGLRQATPSNSRGAVNFPEGLSPSGEGVSPSGEGLSPSGPCLATITYLAEFSDNLRIFIYLLLNRTESTHTHKRREKKEERKKQTINH